MPQNSQTTSLLELAIRILHSCLDHWRLIAWIVVLPTVITAVVVRFVVDPVYGSQAIVLPPSSQNLGSGLSELLGNNAMLGSMFSSSNLLGGDEADVILTIFNTRDLHDRAIERFGMAKRYKFKGKYHADLLKQFRKHLYVYQNDEDVIVVSFEDKDPQLAKDVVDFLVTNADSIYANVKASQASATRKFFERKLDTCMTAIDSLEKGFAQFQLKNQMFDPSSQFEGTYKILTEMETEKSKLDIETDLEMQTRGTSTSRFRELKTRLDDLNAKLRKAKLGKFGDDVSLTLDVKKAPDLFFEYYRWDKELRVQNTIERFLRQKTEEMTLEESRTMRNLVVLQPARFDNKKVRPPRVAIVMLVFGLCTTAGVATAVFLSFLSNQKSDGTDFYKNWSRLTQRLHIKRS